MLLDRAVQKRQPLRTVYPLTSGGLIGVRRRIPTGDAQWLQLRGSIAVPGNCLPSASSMALRSTAASSMARAIGLEYKEFFAFAYPDQRLPEHESAAARKIRSMLEDLRPLPGRRTTGPPSLATEHSALRAATAAAAAAMKAPACSIASATEELSARTGAALMAPFGHAITNDIPPLAGGTGCVYSRAGTVALAGNGHAELAGCRGAAGSPDDLLCARRGEGHFALRCSTCRARRGTGKNRGQELACHRGLVRSLGEGCNGDENKSSGENGRYFLHSPSFLAFCSIHHMSRKGTSAVIRP